MSIATILHRRRGSVTTAQARPLPAPPASDPTAAAMSHREVLEALSGLLLAMFVAMLSSTVVSNALPVIVADLGGTESGYTWVIVATLLSLTATTPIWGKLAISWSLTTCERRCASNSVISPRNQTCRSRKM